MYETKDTLDNVIDDIKNINAHLIGLQEIILGTGRVKINDKLDVDMINFHEKLPKNDEIGKDAVKLLTPARSMILFNSRLIHANSGMSKNHPNKVHINRISAYITFAPKMRRNEETLEKRKRGYIQGETTSHWPNKFEPKRVPFSVSKHYKERNLKHLTPLLTKNNDIPVDRLMYI